MQGFFVKNSFLRLKRLVLAAKYASYWHFLAALREWKHIRLYIKIWIRV